MSKILDGKALSTVIAADLAKQVLAIKTKINSDIKLVIIQIGDLPASTKYIEIKKRFANKLGIMVEHIKYPAIPVGDSSITGKIISDITKYNSDPSIHGIMVQLPIPTIDSDGTIQKANPNITGSIVNAIAQEKDVDGLTAMSMKHLFDGRESESFLPATTRGIITLLEHHHIDLFGKKVVVVGQSALVGRPTALALLNRRATVIVCNRATKDIANITSQADIVIVAAGHPGLITSKHVSSGQIIVDVGISVIDGGKIVGDVDFENVKDTVAAISPVPGGVGPMTIVSLFQNLLQACSIT